MVRKRKGKTFCIFHVSLPIPALRPVFPGRARLVAEGHLCGKQFAARSPRPPKRGAGCGRSHAGTSSASSPLCGQSHKGPHPAEHCGQGQWRPSREGPPLTHLVRQTGRADPPPAGLLGVPPSHPTSDGGLGGRNKRGLCARQGPHLKEAALSPPGQTPCCDVLDPGGPCATCWVRAENRIVIRG